MKLKKSDSISPAQPKQLEIYITIALVVLSFVIRVIRLDIPHDWSFDEVYHALSAEAYALNDPRGYEWFNPSPKDLAYEWLHPPIGKLLMAASIKFFAKPYIPESKAQPLDGRTTFAWRFPGTIFAALTVWLLIIFGKKLFDEFWIGAVAGGLYALDGLSFVQSRTGMNDIFITFFVVLAFYWLYIFLTQYPKKNLQNLLWLGIATGLAASTKWTGFYAVGIAFILSIVFILKKRNWKLLLAGIFCLLIIPIVVYFLSYGQWWLQGHTWSQFVELHKQIWWYQTGLKATHGYQSYALTWPFLYRPVWFYVKYQDVIENGQKVLYIGNIYTMGNPIIWWAGLVGIVYAISRFLRSIIESIFNKSFQIKFLFTSLLQKDQLLPLAIVLVGYFGMFLPWALSPRIMFLYHYLPSVPFLCLALAYGLYRFKSWHKIGLYITTAYLTLVVLVFIYFYPHWSALPLPQSWVNGYYWLPSWK